MSDIIRLQDVSKIYQRGSESIAAVNGVNLDVKPGDMAAIVGPSGSGKSTLLNLIGCVDTPSRGAVNIDGTETSNLKETQLASLRSSQIGFVFQQFFLLPTLSALENVLLPTVFSRNGLARAREARANELLRSVGLADRAGHLPAQLSGGEMQRVAIARALINQPQILLADEPTGNLDTKNAETVFAIFEELHRQGLTIIVVTHNLELSAKCQYTVQLRDGKVVSSLI